MCNQGFKANWLWYIINCFVLLRYVWIYVAWHVSFTTISKIKGSQAIFSADI